MKRSVESWKFIVLTFNFFLLRPARQGLVHVGREVGDVGQVAEVGGEQKDVVLQFGRKRKPDGQDAGWVGGKSLQHHR